MKWAVQSGCRWVSRTCGFPVGRCSCRWFLPLFLFPLLIFSSGLSAVAQEKFPEDGGIAGGRPVQGCQTGVTTDGFLRLECPFMDPWVTSLKVSPTLDPDGLVDGISYKILGNSNFFVGQRNCRQSGYELCDATQLQTLGSVLPARWTWYWVSGGICSTDLNAVSEVKAWAISRTGTQLAAKCLPATTERTIEEFTMVTVCCRSVAASAP